MKRILWLTLGAFAVYATYLAVAVAPTWPYTNTAGDSGGGTNPISAFGTNSYISVGKDGQIGRNLFVGTDAVVNGQIYATTFTTSVSGAGGKAINYGDQNVSASQTTAEWGNTPSVDVGGDIKRVVMPVSGDIVGISLWSNAASTSGTLTAWPTINGTAATLSSGLNTHTGSTTTSYTVEAVGVDHFQVGQAIGVKVTTSSAWAPTTADVGVTVFYR